MRTPLIAVAIALSISPALASAWCPVANGNNATKNLPAESRVVLDAAGHISIVAPGFKADCPQTGAGDVRCARDFSGPCSEPNKCEFRVWFTESGSKVDGLGLDQIDLQHSDLSKAELWLFPEFTVYSELQFAPCAVNDDATM